MSRFAELRAIAARIGIATRHVDALGIAHEPDEETLSRLIEAFGLSPEPAEAAAAIADEGRSAAFGLDPVHIVPASPAPASLTLRLPPRAAAIEWECRFENGGQAAGTSENLPPAGERNDCSVLTLPAGLPLGYHRLELAGGGSTAQIGLAVAPASCHLPDGLEHGARSWGLTAQLYGIRSAGNWGIGDFTDLAQLCRGAGALGAAAFGVNPLHALFAAEPRHISPYSPSSRVFLDYLYIDVGAVPGFREDAAIRELAPPAAIAAARAEGLVDYAAVAALKRPALEALYRRFRTRELGAGGASHSRRGREFRQFQEAGGSALAAFATFEALHEHFNRNGGGFSWRGWPAPMRAADSPEVAAFARSRSERVEFFQFVQWEADRQLGAAAVAARASGLAIGLYRDLAVGVDPHGAEAWADQELVAPGAAIGAPPDPLSRAGQNWGLAPINPRALKRRGYGPFIAALRANMRHAGILRIDHVMALQRLYWVPAGSPATRGAYVTYPFADLVRLLALESRRQRCAVIGEDLGTVPEGFREAMRATEILSYRILAFERRGDGSFIRPGEYPPLAAASAATHDLATLKGFWLGCDIAWRRRLGLYPDAEAEAGEAAERNRDRHLLLEALAAEGLVGGDGFAAFLPTDNDPRYSAELGEAIHAFLAGSRARLMLVQLEDIAGEGEQANLPGTSDGHPNWRRRLSRRLEELLGGTEIARLAARIGELRRQSAAQSGRE